MFERVGDGGLVPKLPLHKNKPRESYFAGVASPFKKEKPKKDEKKRDKRKKKP